MELNDFLEMMKDRQTVKAGSEAMMFCHIDNIYQILPK